ncbi:hypothetical protein KEM52_003869 [Ascosphaera acerosa]|nr:hypothetical protein KEM52_003869 [Ascosphaera acerosa]
MTAGVRLAEEDGDDTACLPTSYWMNTLLLNRSLGSIPPATVRDAQLIELTHCLAPAPGITFAARRRPSTATQTIADATRSEGPACAHGAGATVLAIDHMVSGGADASIHLWDLESRGPEVTHTHLPAASGNRLTSRDAHQKALTSLSIYPFDPVPATVLTTAYDGTLKLSALDRGAGHQLS